MKNKTLKSMTVEELISQMFRMGIIMSGEIKPKKSNETRLQNICKELERRNLIDDANALYEMTCK
jgi:hypothetical protein